MNISKEKFTELAKGHLVALESYKIDENGNKPIEIFRIEKLYEAMNFDKPELSNDLEEPLNVLSEAISEVENLSLSVVSQQRELLKKWWKYFDEESVAINCNDEELEEVITNFFNCG